MLHVLNVLHRQETLFLYEFAKTPRWLHFPRIVLFWQKAGVMDCDLLWEVKGSYFVLKVLFSARNSK